MESPLAYDTTSICSSGSYQTDQSEVNFASEYSELSGTLMSSDDRPCRNQRLTSIINKLTSSQHADMVTHSHNETLQDHNQSTSLHTNTQSNQPSEVAECPQVNQIDKDVQNGETFNGAMNPYKTTENASRGQSIGSSGNHIHADGIVNSYEDVQNGCSLDSGYSSVSLKD